MERERNSTNTNRRESYSWNYPGRLCLVGPSGQGSGVGFSGGFRLSRPLPIHWFFPWTSRALEKRNNSQAVLSVTSGAGLSLSALDSLNTGTFNTFPAEISSRSLSMPCWFCRAGKLSGIHGVAESGRSVQRECPPPSQGSVEVPEYQGRVPCGTEHAQHGEGAQPWCRAGPGLPSNGNSSLDVAL